MLMNMRSLLLTAIFIFGMSARVANPAQAIDVQRTYEAGAIDKKTLKISYRVRGQSLSSPFIWTVDVHGANGVVYSITRNDEWMDKLFADEGYSHGCKGYLDCKKKWYFEELPSNIRKAIHQSPLKENKVEEWELDAMNTLATEFLRSKQLDSKRRARVLVEMEDLLRKGGYTSISVPISPVQDDSSLMYVPSLGYFVPYWND